MVVRTRTYTSVNNHLVLSYLSVCVTEIQFTKKLQNAVLKTHQIKRRKGHLSGYFG